MHAGRQGQRRWLGHAACMAVRQDGGHAGPVLIVHPQSGFIRMQHYTGCRVRLMQHYTGCMVVTSLLQGHGLGVMAWGRHPVSCDHMLLEFSHMEGRGLLVGGTLLGWWKSIGAFSGWARACRQQSDATVQGMGTVCTCHCVVGASQLGSATDLPTFRCAC